MTAFKTRPPWCPALLAVLLLLSYSAVTGAAAASADPSPLPGDGQKDALEQETLSAQLAPAPPAATPPAAAPPARPLPALSLVALRSETWPDDIEARGDIVPWQETRVGTEIGGLRLTSVLVNVGDAVKKGQVLARLNPSTLEAELEAANARLMEAEALLAQAVATLERARRLEPSGGVSQQDLTLYQTQQQTAAARLNAARAQVRTQQLRLESATLMAPDDGIVSFRSQSEGAIVQAGSELFRLIRQGRLEWRSEVKGEALLRLSPGQEVLVRSPLGTELKGRVRQISPTVDLSTRNGFVYVDLPADANLKAGLTVSGTFSLGKRKALVLPSSALVHDGAAARVLKVGPDNKVEAIEVRVGRIRDKETEIVAGLDGRSKVVAQAAEFMKRAAVAGERERAERAAGQDRALPEAKPAGD